MSVSSSTPRPSTIPFTCRDITLDFTRIAANESMAQYNNYGGGSNPYDQRDTAPSGGGYNGGGYNGNNRYGGNVGRDSYGGQNVELEPLAQNGQQFGSQQDPNAILNECRQIDNGIEGIERNLETIRMLQQRALDDPDSSQQSATNSQLDAVSSETMTMYRSFAARIKSLKQQPESGSPKNAPQLGKVDRKLKTAINQYQNVESDFRKKLQTQMARQYKIVRPDASEAEVREAVEDTNQQVFSQALLQSDRRGQSRQALSNVQNRHAAIQKIESQMIELAQLFQDMEALVVQQEDSVTMIEQKGEEVQENLDKGTEHIGTAIKSARSRNRKKWYCLGVVLVIIIIIVVAVVVTQVINKPPAANNNNNNNNNKREIMYNIHGHLAPRRGAAGSSIESLVASLSKETIDKVANAAEKRGLTWVG
ncbi:hypothetical protein V502_05926 [Pseudogymnoascus sp. VKM F-4520 (FW-2644)]|nr:hypothetical protein V502_05926 [Pseudogymnoascus sp. VKM F-4520 (FW-2644)]